MYSGQIRSYSKILGELQDAGNTTTLAHYLELLSGMDLFLHTYKTARSLLVGPSGIPVEEFLKTPIERFF